MIRRDGTSYSDLGRHAGVAGAGQDVSQPTPGYFRHRLRSGAITGGVRIWFGPPSDPVTGEVLDRHWRWQAEMNGDPIDFDRVWPACTGQPITEQEYQRLCARQAWAQKAAPESSYADPFRRRDPLSTNEPLPF